METPPLPPPEGMMPGPITNPEQELEEPLEQITDRPLKRSIDNAVQLAAYEANKERISEMLQGAERAATPRQREIIDPDSSLLVSPEEIERLAGLFPENAWNRVLPMPIVAERAQWFTGRLTEGGGNELTYDPSEALSPTAFVLGSTGLVPNEQGALYMKLHLNDIPESSGFSLEARRIAQAKALVHEFAHTFVTPEFHLNVVNLKLLMPDGTELEHLEVFERLIEVVADHAPITNYSAAYRDAQGEFETDDAGALEVALEEEFVELITARLLGFAVGPDGNITFEPFQGREDEQAAIDEYLNAERIVKPKEA